MYSLLLVYAACDAIAVLLTLMLLWGNGLGFDSQKLAARYTLFLPISAPITLCVLSCAALLYAIGVGIPRLWRLSNASARPS